MPTLDTRPPASLWSVGAAEPLAAEPGWQPPRQAATQSPLFAWPQRLPPPPPWPADERDRMAELRDYAILDTEPDEDYDRLVQLAAALCGTPMAALTFVDTTRQWHKSCVGLAAGQAPRERSFSAQAILDSDQLLEVPDTARDLRFEPAPFGPQVPPIRFYAGVPLKTRSGSAIGVLCVMDHVPRSLNEAQRDALAKLAKAVAAQLKLRRQLRIATLTDRLTGLPNWFHFESQFETAKPSRGVVAFVRLKTVSQINSAHGFRIADAMIKQTADRLRGFTGESAFVGRIKRGLFILFFPDLAPEAFAATTAPQLAALLQAPYLVNALTLVCPVHLGSAAFPRDGNTLDEVVNAADAALQVAIERDEPMAFFDKSVDNVLSMHYRLEPQLRRALQQGEFVNYYQPKIDLASGRIAGVEALIRWIHPERGVVPPTEFVPALESTGLIGEVGGHVIKRAIADWARWRESGLSVPRIAVNVAAAQLRNEHFVDELREALQAVGGDARALSVEVTESILISDMEQAIRVLAQVRALGIPVAIDDFGTGYSSLAYIVTLPIDEVKIDRAFIKKITADAAYKGIVNTCISLAHNLNFTVVAEGVETEAQAEVLKALKCDQAQGYLYSPPATADQMAQMLARRGPLTGRLFSAT